MQELLASAFLRSRISRLTVAFLILSQVGAFGLSCSTASLRDRVVPPPYEQLTPRRFFFFFPALQSIIYALLYFFSSSPFRNSDPGSQSRHFSPPLPATAHAFQVLSWDDFSFILPSSTLAEFSRIVHTHAYIQRFLQSILVTRK